MTNIAISPELKITDLVKTLKENEVELILTEYTSQGDYYKYDNPLQILEGELSIECDLFIDGYDGKWEFKETSFSIDNIRAWYEGEELNLSTSDTGYLYNLIENSITTNK